MSSTELVGSYKKIDFLEIHEGKLKSIKRFKYQFSQIYFTQKLVNTFYVFRVNMKILCLQCS